MNIKLKFKILEHYDCQADFAREAKVNESLVSRVVRGRKDLTIEEQGRWAKLLKADRKELFSY